MIRSLTIALCAATAFVAFPAPAVAAPAGTVDPSFGIDGVSSSPLDSFPGHTASASAQAPNGSIYLALRRWGPAADANLLGIVRFGPDGAFDQSFGQGGVAGVDFGEFPELRNPETGATSQDFNALEVQPDGKIVAVGYAAAAGGVQHMTVARFHANGQRDNSFGQSGQVALDLSNPQASVAHSVSATDDGSLLVGGTRNDDFLVLRLISDGTIDPAFNGSGALVRDLGGRDVATLVRALPGSSAFLVAGTMNPNSSGDPVANAVSGEASLYIESGPSLISIGQKALDYAPRTALLDAASLQTVIAGHAYGTLRASKLNMPMMTPASSFGINGEFSGSSLANPWLSRAHGIARQADGKLLLQSDKNLIRLTGDGQFDDSFGQAGVAQPFLWTTGGGSGMGPFITPGRILVAIMGEGRAKLIGVLAEATTEPGPPTAPTEGTLIVTARGEGKGFTSIRAHANNSIAPGGIARTDWYINGRLVQTIVRDGPGWRAQKHEIRRSVRGAAATVRVVIHGASGKTATASMRVSAASVRYERLRPKSARAKQVRRLASRTEQLLAHTDSASPAGETRKIKIVVLSAARARGAAVAQARSAVKTSTGGRHDSEIKVIKKTRLAKGPIKVPLEISFLVEKTWVTRS